MKKINNYFVLLVILIDIIYMISGIDRSLNKMIICLSFIPIILIPKIFRILLKKEISFKNEIVFVIFIFLAQFVGCIIGLYKTTNWYDSFVHLVSGIVTSYYSIELLKYLKHYNNKEILFNLIFIISITLAVGCLWEIFEFVANIVTRGDPQKVVLTGVTDTMKDIICALLGSLLYACFYLYKTNKKKLNIG